MRVAHPNSASTSSCGSASRTCRALCSAARQLGARALYRLNLLPHPRFERAVDDRAQVSSGCIRMRNTDVIDLYERVKVGAKVVVL
jgi:L,D-transpeptidase catalytic domain